MNSRFMKISSTALLALLLVLSPAFVHAEDAPKSDKNPDNKEKVAKKAPSASAAINAEFPSGKIYARTNSSDAVPLPAKKTAITSANGLLGPYTPGNKPSDELTLKSIGGPSHLKVIQVALNHEQVAKYLRSATGFADKDQAIYLVGADDKGKTELSGYMVQKGEKLLIKLDSPGSLKLISEIKAISEVKSGDTLYLIFHVPANTMPVKLVAANKSLVLDFSAK